MSQRIKQDNTFTLVARLHSHMQTFLQSKMKEVGMEGISPSHGKIIMCLFGTEGLTMKELSQRIHKTPQTVTALVGKLEQKGYVVTAPSPQDGRVTCVTLTPKGEGCKEDFMDISTTLYATQYGDMGEEDIALVRDLLRRMCGNFEG